MELNIEKAKALFPDAIKLQLRINGPATVVDIRRLLPNSVVMLSCKISKNYANVIYSEGAAKRMFPDVSKLSGEVSIDKHRIAYIYRNGKRKGAKLLLNFLPKSDRRLIDILEMSFGDKMVQVSEYAECDMGCIFFENTESEDVERVLLAY